MNVTETNRLFIPLGFDRVADLLIRNGADGNVVGQFGKTALIWAAQKGEQFIFVHNLYVIYVYFVYCHRFICRI